MYGTLKNLINEMLADIIQYTNISESFKVFINCIKKNVNELVPGLETLALKNVVFLRCLSNQLIRLDQDQDIKETLKSLSIVFQWLIGNSQHPSSQMTSPRIQVEFNSWKDYFSENFVLSRNTIKNWLMTLAEEKEVTNLKYNFIDDIKMNITNSDLETMIYNDSKFIAEHLDTPTNCILILLKDKYHKNTDDDYVSTKSELESCMGEKLVRIKLLTDIATLSKQNKELDDRYKVVSTYNNTEDSNETDYFEKFCEGRTIPSPRSNQDGSLKVSDNSPRLGYYRFKK